MSEKPVEEEEDSKPKPEVKKKKKRKVKVTALSKKFALNFEKEWILPNDESFETKYEDKEGGILIQTKPLENCRTVTVRAKVRLKNCTPAQFTEFHLDYNYNESYDGMADEFKQLLQISACQDITYYKSKSILSYIFYPRDFVLSRYYDEIHPGIRINFAKSVEYALKPEEEGVVRGLCKFLCFYSQPHPENENDTLLTYIVNSDARGNVPVMVFDWLTVTFAPSYVESLRKALENYPKWKQENREGKKGEKGFASKKEEDSVLSSVVSLFWG